MRYLLTTALLCGLASSSGVAAQDLQIQVGSQGLAIGNGGQFSGYGSDAYGRRLNRYQNNYGYNRNRQYRNSEQYG